MNKGAIYMKQSKEIHFNKWNWENLLVTCINRPLSHRVFNVAKVDLVYCRYKLHLGKQRSFQTLDLREVFSDTTSLEK